MTGCWHLRLGWFCWLAILGHSNIVEKKNSPHKEKARSVAGFFYLKTLLEV